MRWAQLSIPSHSRQEQTQQTHEAALFPSENSPSVVDIEPNNYEPQIG
jgi:hypothetical protein